MNFLKTEEKFSTENPEDCDGVENDKNRCESTNHACSDCGSVIVDVDEHYKVCSGVNRYTCIEENCIASFTTRQKLREHSRSVHEAPVACPYDDCKSFVKLVDLAQHVEEVHRNTEELDESNENSNNEITDSSQYYLPLKSRRRKNYICDVGDCVQSFFTKLQLNLHLHNDHEAPLRCPYKQCEMEFVSSLGLDIHFKTVHHYAVSSECEHCGKEVQRRWLDKHIIRCTKVNSVRNFKCTMKNCKSSFLYEENLRVHIRTVHAAPKHCPICKKLVSAQSLKRHVRKCTSTGEKKFFCSIKGCKAGFPTFMDKNAHVRVIHRERIKCPIEHCEAMVKPYKLAQHKRNMHSK